MNKKAVIGIGIAVIFPLLCYFIIKNMSRDIAVVPKHYIYDSVISKTVNGKLVADTVWHQLPDFKLNNQMGERIGWKDMEGKTVVANFFFTRCPTICPQLTLNMKLLQDKIKSSNKVGARDASFLQFLSFSVDPERDSVDNLKKWADRFQINPQNWHLLTGDKKTIYDLSIEHMKLGLVDGKGIDTSFFHTDYMVLIDKDRQVRGYYHGLDTMEVKRLAQDIIFLTLEKDPRRKSVFAGKLELLAVVFLLTILGLGLMFYALKKFR